MALGSKPHHHKRHWRERVRAGGGITSASAPAIAPSIASTTDIAVIAATTCATPGTASTAIPTIVRTSRAEWHWSPG